jgi:BirA family biotin operon repressor/biotin-[acetyl-CoA-carboxylase] ligase
MLAEGRAGIGDLVVADEQTAGRGRFGRVWISPSGGLYATAILPPEPLLPIRTGLAIVKALRSAGIRAGLKWPNDVLVDGLKIAGLLIDADGERSLVGIGLNLASAPLETATCVAHHGGMTDRDTWAWAILDALTNMEEGSDLDEYRRECLTLGRSVLIEGSGDRPPVEGVAVDVDEGGRLVVNTKLGRTIVSSGECLHLCARYHSS